jgi:hypothetical protein
MLTGAAACGSRPVMSAPGGIGTPTNPMRSDQALLA